MKVVKRRLADGTIREYRYDPKQKRRRKKQPLTLERLVREWEASAEYQQLALNSKKTYRKAVAKMAPLFKVHVADIKRRHAVRLRDLYQTTPATANVVLATLRALMTFAVDQDYIEVNPARGIKTLKIGHHEPWSDEEIRLAVEHLPAHVVRVIQLALYTGQRHSDLVRMKWSDVSFETGEIRVRQEKTKIELWIPLHSHLAELLGSWPRTAVTILTSGHGRPWASPHTSAVTYNHAREKAGILKGKVIHGLRATAATKLAEAGCSVHEIMAITGHTSLQTVALYTRKASQRRNAKAAILRLENAGKTTPK